MGKFTVSSRDNDHDVEDLPDSAIQKFTASTQVALKFVEANCKISGEFSETWN